MRMPHVTLRHPPSVQHQDEVVIKKLAERMPDIGKKMEYLLNTGAI
jgi:hypothetical protein